MPRRPAKNSQVIQATLEFSFLQGGPFSQHLLDSVLLNFVDELEESLHEDADDALIGVKSTARKFGAHSKKWVAGFYTLAFILITLGFLVGGVGLSGILLLAGAAQLAWQVKTWDMDNPASSMRFMNSNRNFGLILLLAAAF